VPAFVVVLAFNRRHHQLNLSRNSHQLHLIQPSTTCHRPIVMCSVYSICGSGDLEGFGASLFGKMTGGTSFRPCQTSRGQNTKHHRSTRQYSSCPRRRLGRGHRHHPDGTRECRERGGRCLRPCHCCRVRGYSYRVAEWKDQEQGIETYVYSSTISPKMFV
jgi:hypothetical protein